MTDNLLLKDVQHSLEKYVELKKATDLDELKKYLTQELVYMMKFEMEKLMGLLYRIDVREQDVKTAFAQDNPTLIAPMLAEAIILRELEKAQSRKDHRKV